LKPWVIIFPPSIGDAICASATLNRIVFQYPKIEFNIICSDIMKNLFASLENVAHSFTYEQVAKTKIQANHEWLIDLFSDDKSFELYSHINFDNNVSRDPTNQDKYVVNGVSFSIGVFMKGAVGRSGNPNEPAWMLEAPLVAHILREDYWAWLNEDYEPFFKFKHRNNEHIQTVNRYDVIIAPCGSFGLKKWPEKYWVSFSKWLISNKYKIAVILGPHEYQEYSELTKLKKIHFYVNEDLYFISELFRNVKVVVANDCGPMHLAAACGSPVISIFGPTNPQIWFRYKKIKSMCLQEGSPENEWGELRHIINREWDRWPTSQKLIDSFLVFNNI
jgi:ADP-heptose:LPS heptosyltransferase